MDGSDADPVYSDYQCSIICAFSQAGSLFQRRGNDPESVKRTGISAHYRELEQHQQEIRRIRHDIKNELSGIYGYLENGEMEEGKKEIEILLQQMTAAEQKIFTANAVVNGILNLKSQKMEMAQTHTGTAKNSGSRFRCTAGKLTG